MNLIKSYALFFLVCSYWLRKIHHPFFLKDIVPLYYLLNIAWVYSILIIVRNKREKEFF